MPFRRQEVDYSYVPMAFSRAKQGISDVADFSAKMKKQEEFEENLKRVKVSREQVQKARDEAIVELATQYREAAGLPNDDVGYDRALSVVSSAVYPLTSKEMNDPDSAARRINGFELDQFPKMLNKAKMDRYRKETESTQEQIRPEGAAPMQPQGQVGVEDEGVYRTMAQPQSVGDLQSQTGEQMLNEPYAAPEVSRDPTSEEMRKKARGIFGPEIPAPIQSEIGTKGRLELAEGEYPEGYTKERAYGDVAKKPVIEKDMEIFTKQFPETPEPPDPLSELDRAKIAKLRADARRLNKKAASGGADVKFSDLAKLQKQRNDVEKTIKDVSKVIADINNKLSNPRRMDVDGGETADSLIGQRDMLNNRLQSSKKQLPGIDNDISEIRKRLEVPEVEPEDTEADAGPTPEAQKIAVSIRNMMDDESVKPNKKYRVMERFGEPVYFDPKKKRYDSSAYKSAMQDQVYEFARSKGVKMPIDRLAIALTKNSLEDVIEAIIKKSGESK